MMTRTGYDPKVLNKLREERITDESLDVLLKEYQRDYKGLIRSKSQRLYFSIYIKGFLNGLDRKQ